MKAQWLLAIPSLMLAIQTLSAQAPAGSTGQCKDGTYTTAASKSGACRGHKGVQTWLAASGAPPAAPTAPPARTAAPPAPTAAPPAPTAAAAGKPQASTPPTVPAVSQANTPAPNGRKSPSAAAASRPQAAGGGPGLVWVNTSTKVYHCPGSDFYGKTKDGKYMSEADAKTAGAHADHNKPCTK